MSHEKHKKITLKRSLSLGLLTFYGLGTILGAGIYALVGKVAKHAGMYSPIAFLIAAFIALFTCVSYGELSSRYPVSAGEAYFVKKGFNSNWLSAVTGYLTILTGIVSAAAISHGFAGYLRVFFPIPSFFSICVLFAVLSTLAIWGIFQSAVTAMIITLIEIGGLFLVIFTANTFDQLPNKLPQMLPSFQLTQWSGIFSGALLAFYAYIGFEDMENVAEEVKNPEKNLPLAMFIALGLATILYLLVTCSVIFALPPEVLSSSEAPLAEIMKNKGHSSLIITAISLVAMINGALIQLIMSSRILYGLANQHNAPRVFSNIYSRTQTPVIATGVITLITLFFALGLPIETLANITSIILLCVFILVNASLIVIKTRKVKEPKAITFPIIFPIMGVILSTLFLFLFFINF